MKKPFILILLCIIFSLNVILAMDWDNVIRTEPSTFTKYPVVEIKNAFGLGSTLSRNEIIEHTEYCGVKCWTDYNITLYSKQTLLGEITYLQNKDGWKDYNIKEQKIFIKTGDRLKTINEEVCTPATKSININGSLKDIQTVECKIIGREIKEPVWEEYKGEEKEEGEYKIRIQGNKNNPYEIIDFQPTFQGVKIYEHATWNSTFANQLKAYYDFETNDSKAVDVATGVNNGTIYNSISLDNGKHNNAYKFEDINSAYVEIQDNPTLDINYYTITAWVNMSENVSSGTFLSKGFVTGSNTPYLFRRDTASYVWGSYDGTWRTSNYNTFTVGRWYFAVMTHNETGMYVYINGTLAGSYIGSFTAPSTQANVTIGADNNNFVEGNFYDGLIDELAIYNRAMGETEILSLYDGGTGTFWTEAPTTTVTLYEPAVNYYNSSSSTVNFNCSAAQYLDSILNITLKIDGINNYTVYNTTASAKNLSLYKSVNGLNESLHNWTCMAVSVASSHTASLKYFRVDLTKPIVSILYPQNVTYMDGYIDENRKLINLNFSASDSGSGLNKCWYFNGTANTTITCGTNATINITYGSKEFRFYANDTAGNENSTSVFTTYQYEILYNSQAFSTITYEGNVENFTINISYDSARFTNIRGILTYNNTNYTGIKTGTGDNIAFYTTLTVPRISNQINKSFYWTIGLNNGTWNDYKTTINNQTIKNITLDNCGSYTFNLLNISLKDEELQVPINTTSYNSTVEISLQIYPLSSSVAIRNHTTNFSSNNPRICLETELFNSNYRLDAQIKYDGDGYASEYYHIQNFSLKNSTLQHNIDLFDLLDADSQAFKITFKDENFLAVEGAIIQVQRKYIGEGLYKSVEIPKTDSNGETIAYLVVNDIIYNFVVLKDGVVLGTFTDLRAICQNPTIETCIIPLSIFASSISPKDFTIGDDFTFVLTYDKDTRAISTIFTVPSGVSSDVVLNATLFDNLGQTQACSDSLTSSSGTLSCIIPASLGNGTVIAKIIKDDVLMGQAMISLEQKPSDLYGSNIIFLGLFLTLTLVGIGVQDNAMITGLFIILGAILLIALNLVDTGLSSFVGAGATVLYLIIAVILILIKASRRQ